MFNLKNIKKKLVLEHFFWFLNTNYKKKKLKKQIYCPVSNNIEFFKNIDYYKKKIKFKKIEFKYIESYTFRKAYHSIYLKKVPLKLADMVLTYNNSFKDNLYFTQSFEENEIYKKYPQLVEDGFITDRTFQLYLEKYAEDDDLDHLASDFNTIELPLWQNKISNLEGKIKLKNIKLKKVLKKKKNSSFRNKVKQKRKAFLFLRKLITSKQMSNYLRLIHKRSQEQLAVKQFLREKLFFLKKH